MLLCNRGLCEHVLAAVLYTIMEFQWGQYIVLWTQQGDVDFILRQYYRVGSIEQCIDRIESL
jgi:hypothetical protein